MKEFTAMHRVFIFILIFSSCNKIIIPFDEFTIEECLQSPTEPLGNYPTIDPENLVRQDIVEGREGIPLQLVLSVEDVTLECLPMNDVFVDVWHVDSKGAYSQYDENRNENFLRGRQTTTNDEPVIFNSIYPGFRTGRAPHIHVEIRSEQNTPLLSTQIAFPEKISNIVLNTEFYEGSQDRKNIADGVFSDGFQRNLPNEIEGDTVVGYILTKSIKVGTVVVSPTQE